MFKSEDWGVKELANLFGLSQRTVQRALKTNNKRQVTSSKEKDAQ
jgi:DeoR/GlpR family transcriptional regulator of sugar metabolism